MRVPRSILVVASVLALVVGVAPAALAAPPANDDYVDATAVTLPFAGSVSTVEATTESTDPLDCAGAAHSVWYTFTSDFDGYVGVDTFGSDFDTVLTAFTGAPGSFSQIACNDDTGGGVQSAIRFAVASGTTYSIMAHGCCGGSDGTEGSSGNLVLNADVASPPLTFRVTVANRGKVNPSTGIAKIHGRAVCSEPATFHNDDGVVRQRVGRLLVTAYPFREYACGPEPVRWSMPVIGTNGLFVSGKAQLSSFLWHAFTDTQDAGQEDAPKTITLKP
jgi:hypothetical protein